MSIEISVERSPAKMAWWVMVNGVMFHTSATKYGAEAIASEMRAAWARFH
jgi:hypothetical protein